MRALTLILLITGLWPMFEPHAAGADAEKTAKFIAVLRSDAPVFEKARACQQLGEVGTAEAVPALAALLPDERLGAYARSGLEGIAHPSAAAALREALGKTKGLLRAGIVNSLGVIRDADAAEPLSRLAADPQSGAAKEALLALGRIATGEAIKILSVAMTSGPAESQTEAASGCLLAAERRLAAGDRIIAIEMYDRIRQGTFPAAIRAGASRGAILARQTGQVQFLVEQLRSEDRVVRNAALQTARELPADELATVFNRELRRAVPELQVQILAVLADRPNAESPEAVRAALASTMPEVRTAALATLGKIGGDAEARALAQSLEKLADQGEYAATLAALREIKGVEEVLVRALSEAVRPQTATDLIRLLEERHATEAVPVLLARAADPDPKVRVAALSALKPLAGQGEVEALLPIIRAAKDEGTLEAAENALAGACVGSAEANPGADRVLRELERASLVSERNSWVRVLITVGYKKALPVIEAAARDNDPAVAENAIRHLGRWPDSTPLEPLLKIVETSSNTRLKQRALTSALDLAAVAAEESQSGEARTAGWLARLSRAAESQPDRRRVVSVLGSVKTPESLQLLLTYLDQPGTEAEAAAAILQVAPVAARMGAAAAAKAALQRVAKDAKNTDLRDKAAGLVKSL